MPQRYANATIETAILIMRSGSIRRMVGSQTSAMRSLLSEHGNDEKRDAETTP